jgi:hypothetical protein
MVQDGLETGVRRAGWEAEQQQRTRQQGYSPVLACNAHHDMAVQCAWQCK